MMTSETIRSNESLVLETALLAAHILLENGAEISRVEETFDRICRHYGVTNIRLHDIDKQWGHPSVKGMESICRQVGDVLSAAR